MLKEHRSRYNISLEIQDMDYLKVLADSKDMTTSKLIGLLAKELREKGIVDVEAIPKNKNSRRAKKQ